MYLQKPMQGSVYAARKRQYQGRSEGGREAQFPWHRITIGAPNHCGDAEKSQQCHKYFPRYSAFASERPQV